MGVVRFPEVIFWKADANGKAGHLGVIISPRRTVDNLDLQTWSEMTAHLFMKLVVVVEKPGTSSSLGHVECR